MTLILEVTGDEIDDGKPLASLLLDDKSMLGVEYQALQKIIVQMVQAMNALHQQVGKCQEGEEQMVDSMQHIEQQLSTFEIRSRDNEESCQEIRLQLGTMAFASQEAPEDEIAPEEKSDVTRQELTDIIQKVDGIMRDVENESRSQRGSIDSQNRKMGEIEDMMNKHQEFFDDDLEGRLAQNDDDRHAIKADLEAVRTSLEECNNRKASKVEVGDIAQHVKTLDEGQTSNSRMLQEAGKQFTKLDGLADLVNENQSRMQEMWAMFSKESQELREWASSGFVQLRSGVQSKMSEQEALSHVGEIRKEVRDLAPFVSEAMARVEADMSHKAEASDVQRLQDQYDVLNRNTGRPKQLLVGTKCLACDRQVSTAGETDRGPICLNDKRQEEELWNEVQKALDKGVDHRQPSQKDVLKYVAIHVGNPSSSPAGRSFEHRDRHDETPGGHYLMRVGGGGGSLGRPKTHDGCDRSPPREMPTMYRVSPRRPGKYVAAPPVTGTSRGGPRRAGGTSVRAALGSAADNVPSPGRNPEQSNAMSSTAPEAYWPVRIQPGAHSGMAQPHGTDYDVSDQASDGESDAYVIAGNPSPV